MLEFILGRARTGKTTLLRAQLAAEKTAQAILIVPEQYTFETERALLETFGVETANRIRVYSFTRLAEAAFLRYGGHDMAAGLNIRAENIPAFRRALAPAF